MLVFLYAYYQLETGQTDYEKQLKYSTIALNYGIEETLYILAIFHSTKNPHSFTFYNAQFQIVDKLQNNDNNKHYDINLADDYYIKSIENEPLAEIDNL